MKYFLQQIQVISAEQLIFNNNFIQKTYKFFISSKTLN